MVVHVDLHVFGVVCCRWLLQFTHVHSKLSRLYHSSTCLYAAYFVSREDCPGTWPGILSTAELNKQQQWNAYIPGLKHTCIIHDNYIVVCFCKYVCYYLESGNVVMLQHVHDPGQMALSKNLVVSRYYY